MHEMRRLGPQSRLDRIVRTASSRIVAGRRLALIGLILQALFFAGMFPAAAQDVQTPAQSASSLDDQIKATKGEVAALARDVEAQRGDFKALLGLRAQADGLIYRVQVMARELPAINSSSEADSAKRRRTETEASLRDAENLRERITDLRRRQMAGRLYAASFSPLAPSFWSDILTLSISTTHDQLVDLRVLWTNHAAEDLWADTAIMAIAVVVLLTLAAAVRRAISTRILGSRSVVTDSAITRRALMLRALVTLVLSALPIPIALAILVFIDRQVEFAPDELEPFFTSAILVWAGVSLGITTLQIALQPNRPKLRLVGVTDEQASTLYRAGLAMMLFYGIAIALNELMGALHFLVALSAATTMVWVIGCCFCIGWALVRMGRSAIQPIEVPDEDVTPARGIGTALVVAAPVYQRRVLVGLEICGWIVVAISLFSVLTGYLALAGFVMGRFIVTLVLWTLAYIFLMVIDALLKPSVPRSSQADPFLSRVMAPSVELSDFLSVIIAGVLRVAIFLPMVFVTLGPWHLEYGDVNPFQDAFAGLNLAELRDAIGSAGFATVCLLLGLTATKVFTSWLDGSLLPYTKLESGVRYSLTTIVGYGGIALSIILALSQLGVSPQSLTVIASALSVGIGFGLQSIVSNFVSGLIVLTERRVRVGDVVNVKGEEGCVRKINVRSTLITTTDNIDLIVPNTDLITSIVRNKTLTGAKPTLRLPLIVRHDVDLTKLFDTVISVTYHHDNVLTDPPPTMVLTKPGPAGLEFEVVCVLVDNNKAAATRSELYLHWIELFRAQGISLAQDGTPAVS